MALTRKLERDAGAEFDIIYILGNNSSSLCCLRIPFKPEALLARRRERDQRSGGDEAEVSACVLALLCATMLQDALRSKGNRNKKQWQLYAPP